MPKIKKLHHVGRRTLSFFKRFILIIISLLLIILQLVGLYAILFTASSFEWLYITVELIGIICVIDLMTKDMVCNYKIVWIVLILAFPFVGAVFYIFCGDERTFPKRKSAKIKKYLNTYIPEKKNLDELKEIDPVLYKHISVLVSGCDFPYYKNTNVLFYSDINEKKNQLIDDLNKATKYIFIEYFIISSGKMLDEIIEALNDASRRGVEIKIIYDAFGSNKNFSPSDLKKIKKNQNLQIVKFAPFGITLNLTVNYRDHRKIVVIDGKVGYVGGDNIADEYANYIERFGIWRDNAVRLEGDAVTNLVYMFAETWYLSTKKMLNVEEYKTTYECKSTSVIMPYSDGPTDKRNPAIDLYASLANNAKDYLYISTPYLIIDRDFLHELIMAKRSGVDVKILLPGIPDKKMVYLMTRSHYGMLLKEGIKIYEYTPGFNHAKNFICDDAYGVVGTVNVDYRSLYLHFENGVFISDLTSVLKMKENFLSDLEKSKEINYKLWQKRPIFIKIIEFILKIFSTLM